MEKSEEKRTHLNIRVKPPVKRVLQTFAKRERRSLGNVAELLLDWAAEHLQRADSTLTLLEAKVEISKLAMAQRRADLELLVDRHVETDRDVFEGHHRAKKAKAPKAG